MESKSSNKIVKKSEGGKNSISRNPFFNFLSDFRKKNKGLSPQELVYRAGEAWRNMTEAEKAPFREMAKRAPKTRKRRRRRHRRDHGDTTTESEDSED